MATYSSRTVQVQAEAVDAPQIVRQRNGLNAVAVRGDYIAVFDDGSREVWKPDDFARDFEAACDAPGTFAVTDNKSGGRLNLSWVLPVPPSGKALAGIQVAQDGVVVQNLAASATSTTITSLTNGTAYAIKVRAILTDGSEGVWTTALNRMPTPGAMTVTDVDPKMGVIAGGTAVTITGTNFYGSPTVTFGGTAATSVVRVSATEITCVTPAKSAALVNVVVTNLNGDTGTGTSLYRFASAPTITGLHTGQSGYVSGELATAGGYKTFSIDGTNFYDGEDDLAVTVNGFEASSVTINSATQITVTVPDVISLTPVHDDPVTIVVTTDLGTATDDELLKIAMAPTLDTVDPASGDTDVGTEVTITGTNFVPGFTSVVADPADANVPCGPTTVVDSTELTTTVSEEVPWTDGAETIALRIATPGAAVVFAAAFEYTAP